MDSHSESGTSSGSRFAAASTGWVPPRGVNLHVQVKLDMAELSTFRPDQIAAIMEGVGKVLSAQNTAAPNGELSCGEP